MMKEFDIPHKTRVALGLTTYQIGLALGPLLLAPMSELFGRRPVYQVSMGLFSILILPACFAKKLETILVSRFFAYVVSPSLILQHAFAELPGGCADREYTVHSSDLCLFPTPQAHSVIFSTRRAKRSRSAYS